MPSRALHRSPHRARGGGFTIIELMVTLAVAAILVALAAPGMAEFFDRRRLAASAEGIVDLLQEGRSQAVKGNRFVIVTIAPSGSWYIGLQEVTTLPGTLAACVNDPDDYTDGCHITVGGDQVFRVATSSSCSDCSVTSPGTASFITFDFRGLNTTGSAQSITLQSPKGKQLQISVDILGHVSTCSPASAQIPGYPTCS